MYDIHTYKANRFRKAVNGEEVIDETEVVFEIISSESEPIKREEIIQKFMIKSDLTGEHEVASQLVDEEIAHLMNDKRIERASTGYYRVREVD